MLNIQLATKYARAIFELAQEENKLDDYDNDLSLIQEDVFTIPDAVTFFKNPLVPHQAKKDLLTKAFKGEISDNVMNFLLLLTDKNRIGIFNEIYEIFTNLKNDAQGILVADVTTAFPLTKAQESKIGMKLAAVTHKRIQIRRHEDKNILGGVIVRIGDKRIDGSAAGRLQALKSSLSTDR